MAESPEPRPKLSAVVNERPAYPPSQDIDDDEIDLGELIGVLIENRWLILAVMLGITMLGAGYAWTTTPIYQADALLQVEEKKSGIGDLDINALFEGDTTSVNAEIEILRSRSVLGTVVDNLKLDIVAEPEYFPVIGAALARRKDASERPAIKVETLDVPEPMLGQPLHLIARGGNTYELLDESGNGILRGKVGERAGGDAIGLFVSQLQAEEGQSFLLQKKAGPTAIEDLKEMLAVAERGKSSGILAVTVEGANPEALRQQVDEIANVYVRQNVERKSEEAAQTLAFLDDQLPAVKRDMEAAEVALNSYRLEKGSVDLPLETQAILETIVTVEGQLNELRQQRDAATQAFTSIHPTVIALDRQIQTLSGQLGELNAQVRELPTTQQEVLRLVRDVEVNTVLYTSLLNTAQELRVVKAGTVGNARVIDHALQPVEPIKPKPLRVLLLALMLGGFAGVAAAFAKKALMAGVEDPDLIEKQINIPVYATISHSKAQDRIVKELRSNEAKPGILAVGSPDDAAIESLRNLRTALHFGMMEVKNNCIMITGPSPEVGKSFVSVNLAAVLTSNGKKVLLIDADLRRGHLHEYLGFERKNGLSDFISGDIPIGEALHQTTVPNLMLIPSGTTPPNPSELLLHQRFTNCLSVLRPRYDHIIIDSPPVLAVTDATIIGQMAGGTLMVLKAGAHPMREIEQSVKRLKQAGVNVRGLLFNDVNVQSQRYGAGKYSYQYAYKTS